MAKKKGPATGKKSKHRFSHKQMDAPKEKPSAFEARSGKLKFDILGRKVKGEKGNMLKARTAGVAKRKSTLLREYHAAGKANAFLDRRFGEGDQSMTPEERAIGRLARARLRQLRPGKQSFALGDDDDGTDAGARGRYDDDAALTLTHGGVPIDEATLERRSAHAAARGRGRGRGRGRAHGVEHAARELGGREERHARDGVRALFLLRARHGHEAATPGLGDAPMELGRQSPLREQRRHLVRLVRAEGLRDAPRLRVVRHRPRAFRRRVLGHGPVSRARRRVPSRTRRRARSVRRARLPRLLRASKKCCADARLSK